MFDTHCHLSDKKFNTDRDKVIARAKQAGINRLLIVCSDVEEFDTFNKMLDEYEFIYGTVGVHPHDAKNFQRDWQIIQEVFKKDKIVALGEIGLDYHYEYSPREAQKEAFRKQLRIAKEKQLPVVIHSREAMDDCLGILKEEDIDYGVMHCFSASKEAMYKCIDMGLYISIAGVVTFPKANKLREIAKAVPLEKLLIETDAPYLAPQPVRGRRNEPSYMKYTLDEIAAIRGISKEVLIEAITKNSISLFNLQNR